MKPNTRSLAAVLIAGLLVWCVLSSSLLFRTSWWAFLLMLGFAYLVVDAFIEAIYERVRK